MHIGVFDSGIGGEAIALALAETFPDATLQVVNDRTHVPYGDRESSEIFMLTDAAIQPLLAADCDVIVIACNTATTLALPRLRTTYPQQRFIGIEPMIKPATVLTKAGVVAVCATPATLASSRYHELLATYASDTEIIEPDCHDWASLIENNEMNRAHIAKMVGGVKNKNADVIVLGCTHYHWIKDEIIREAGPAISVLEPSAAIGERIKQLLGLPQ